MQKKVSALHDLHVRILYLISYGLCDSPQPAQEQVQPPEICLQFLFSGQSLPGFYMRNHIVLVAKCLIVQWTPSRDKWQNS